MYEGARMSSRSCTEDPSDAGTLLISFMISLMNLFQFLPARRYAIAGLCYSDVSVCLSVCLSVTRRYCV